MAKHNPVREERITMEVVVDAYSAEEQAIGWYYYLDDKIQFPFMAIDTTAKKESQPVKVISMADEEDCEQEMFVNIEWEEDILATPLSKLKVVEATATTQEAVDDWHYWLDQGYSFYD